VGISLDSHPVKAQAKINETPERVRALNQEDRYVRRFKKTIRKIRNRRRTKIGLRVCRPTRRRKARESRPAAGSEKRPDPRRCGRKEVWEARRQKGQQNRCVTVEPNNGSRVDAKSARPGSSKLRPTQRPRSKGGAILFRLDCDSRFNSEGW
jgi:hypothetical protein